MRLEPVGPVLCLTRDDLRDVASFYGAAERTAPRTCATCKHYCAGTTTQVHERVGFEWTVREITTEPTCHRNPPEWPVVKPTDYCGEWQAR